MRFKHLPEELKDVPEDELVALDLHASPFVGQSNKKVVDPDSECRHVVRIVPSDPAHPLDWAVVRDLETEQRDTFGIKPTKGDGYRWYRLGVSLVGRAGACVLQSGMQFFVGDLYMECDGMDEVTPGFPPRLRRRAGRRPGRFRALPQACEALLCRRREFCRCSRRRS